MAALTREWIEEQIAALEERYRRLIADAQATSGAVQAWRAALERLASEETIPPEVTHG